MAGNDPPTPHSAEFRTFGNVSAFALSTVRASFHSRFRICQRRLRVL
jgi:hypothetical protein